MQKFARRPKSCPQSIFESARSFPAYAAFRLGQLKKGIESRIAGTDSIRNSTVRTTPANVIIENLDVRGIMDMPMRMRKGYITNICLNPKLLLWNIIVDRRKITVVNHKAISPAV